MSLMLLLTTPGSGSSSRQALQAHRSDERIAVRSRFSWDTLSVTNAISCGCNKCYFPPQLSERENEGWLVGRPTCETVVPRGVLPKGFGCHDVVASTPWFPPYSRTWEFAEQLQTRFGVGHMLSRPPEITALTSEQAKSLNDNLKREIDRLKCPGYKPALGSMLEPKRYYSSGPHPVQAVRSCPWPSCIMLGCTSLKANSFIRGRTSFLAHAPNKTKLSQGIRRNFARVKAMVKAHPCLKLDFQVFLRNDGSVLNIDLDRCYQLELATSMHSPPLSEAFQRNLTAFQLQLARRPGICETPWHQTRLSRAIKSLYEA